MDLSLSFHQRLNITPEKGEMRDGAIRYLIMRPDVLMGMFARLPETARAEALSARAASAAQNGGKSVKAYRDSGAVQPEAMMKPSAATSGELGWGVWSFETISPEQIDISVKNSPFAFGIGDSGRLSETPICAPITGMLTAIGPLLLGCETVDVAEVSCHAQTAKGLCHFTIRRQRNPYPAKGANCAQGQ
jgi:predicted hydrocarbon binding protein